MIKKIDPYLTTLNIQPLDYGLNRISETLPKSRLGKFGRHSIQIFSYITHPIDIGIQAIAYPLLRFTNPFICVGIDLANKEFKKAGINAILIPFSFLKGIIGTAIFELSQLIRLVWSISGANTAMNVYNGKYQSWDFFKQRRERDECATPDTIVARMAPYIPIYNHSGTMTHKELGQAIAKAKQDLAKTDDDDGTTVW